MHSLYRFGPADRPSGHVGPTPTVHCATASNRCARTCKSSRGYARCVRGTGDRDSRALQDDRSFGPRS
jgi:hypothetical protein